MKKDKTVVVLKVITQGLLGPEWQLNLSKFKCPHLER